MLIYTEGIRECAQWQILIKKNIMYVRLEGELTNMVEDPRGRRS